LQDRVFRADGTFAGDKSRSPDDTANRATPQSTALSPRPATAAKNSVGRWRLDGPLLTLEQNGQRTVHIAFIMPNWSKDQKPVRQPHRR
jgi:hypothetical protein